MKRASSVSIAAALLACLSHAAVANIVVLGQFDPSGAGGLCGAAFSSQAQTVWVYGCSGTDVQGYSSGGVFQSSAARPGESANDVDLEVAPESVGFGDSALPNGTLFFINGETGPAEIYAIDPTTGVAIDTLTTAFGASHVVGGAYHPGRDTFFLVQDRVPAAGLRNRVAEIDPATGSVLNSFEIGTSFDVNFGDLDICASTGNLLVVSSLEAGIGEFTPEGQFLLSHPLPAGVTSLSGIGVDEGSGEAWVSGTGGTVWRLGGLPCGTVSVEPGAAAGVPVALARPNPSTGPVSIFYSLSVPSAVTVRVFDTSGRLVRTVFDGARSALDREFVWDARDEQGRPVGSGVYRCEIRTEDGSVLRRSVVMLR